MEAARLADRRQFETVVEQVGLDLLGRDNADITRFGNEIAAAAARLVRTLIALLEAEGAALIGNPIDHGDDSPVALYRHSRAPQFRHGENSGLAGY